MKTLTDWFNTINEKDLHPSQLIRQLAQQLDISDSPLYRTGLRIGYEADKGSKEVASYHNYIHTSEAMASMYEMASVEFKDIPQQEVERLGLSRKEELVFLAVTVMAAHDLYHDGKDKAVTNPSKELEAQSARAATAIAFQEGVSRPIIDTLQRAIEATIVDPDLNDITHTAYHANRHDAVAAISQMATESDLAASISPTWGPTKGELLANEVEQAGNTSLAAGLRSFNGRKFFLENICEIHSVSGKALGLEEARQQQVKAMEKVQQSLSPTLCQLQDQMFKLQQAKDLSSPEMKELQIKLRQDIQLEIKNIQSEHGTPSMLKQVESKISTIGHHNDGSLAMS